MKAFETIRYIDNGKRFKSKTFTTKEKAVEFLQRVDPYWYLFFEIKEIESNR